MVQISAARMAGEKQGGRVRVQGRGKNRETVPGHARPTGIGGATGGRLLSGQGGGSHDHAIDRNRAVDDG